MSDTKNPDVKTEKGADPRVTVAGKIDPDVWDKCIERAFRESRARSNSAVVEAALKFYAG